MKHIEHAKHPKHTKLSKSNIIVENELKTK